MHLKTEEEFFRSFYIIVITILLVFFPAFFQRLVSEIESEHLKSIFNLGAHFSSIDGWNGLRFAEKSFGKFSTKRKIRITFVNRVDFELKRMINTVKRQRSVQSDFRNVEGKKTGPIRFFWKMHF